MLWEKSNTFFLGTGFTFHDNHLNTSRDLYKLLRARFENDGAPLIIRAAECETEAIFDALTSFRKNAEAGRSRAAFLDYCRALEYLIAGEVPEKTELSKKDIIVKIEDIISLRFWQFRNNKCVSWLQWVDIQECVKFVVFGNLVTRNFSLDDASTYSDGLLLL
jgi:hypothetical protein